MIAHEMAHNLGMRHTGGALTAYDNLLAINEWAPKAAGWGDTLSQP